MPLLILFAAIAAFVAGHFLLSHPLRDAAVRTFGEQGFRFAYSAIAVVLLPLAFIAFRRAPHVPVLWDHGHPLIGLAFDVVTYISVVLFTGSLFGNPARYNRNRELMLEQPPRGTVLMTRHPMMFAFALWSIAEIVLVPAARQAILFGGIAIFAIAGAALQDRKLLVLFGKDWRLWMERTPFWPDPRRITAPGLNWLFALIPWLILTWLHTHLGQEPVGIWLLETK
ncbi:NnrU family protein [Novosphingobium sp.]|uniref:NnrU family protein n=1 Tax=Novosphingobium sp. TaxID=1874826 RepID=UPI003341B5C1